MTTPVTKISYQELSYIDFSSSKTKKQKLDAQINGSTPVTPSPTIKRDNKSTSYKPSESQISKFYTCTNNTNTKPAILSLIPPFNEKYIPKLSKLSLPEPMTKIYSH